MLNRFFISILLIGIITFSSESQIVKLSPTVASDQDEVKLTFDADQGDGNLASAEKIYMHAGVITSGPDGQDWQYVVGNWGEDDGIGLMTKVDGENNNWEITLSPSIRAYFDVPESENIFRLAMVFRNADGSIKGAGTTGLIDGGEVAENGDIYQDLQVDAFVSIENPTQRDLFLLPDEVITINASSSVTASELVIAVDEGSGFVEQSSTTNAESISVDYLPATSGEITIKVSAIIEGNLVEKSTVHHIYIRKESEEVALPMNIKLGINYSGDPTKATLALFAPEKEFVYVVGDFTNWEIDENYQMNISPNEDVYWIEIDGLEANKEYVFQYWVDGSIKIGDPYADKVADPYNDQFIPANVYPDLIAYDKTEFGIASVLQTDQEDYEWAASEENWAKPAKEDLIVYELLVRDFIGSHDYKDLVDTLSYLKTLGVNAIELLPIMEFEGNESWGYNPSYFFAPDKYYGTKNDLKKFIETAHQEGFAVILDMVLNHAFGQNALVRMYWDEINNRPAANSPWFNQTPTHPFNVGFDFNHESIHTKQFIDSVNHYWISEYHFDGYRFDLSKGFTQTNNPDDVGAWSAFDQSRIDLLTRMANKLWEIDDDAYVILEHFADFQEESQLVSEGMMVWRNKNFDYRKVVAGSIENNFSGADVLDWITYMESHDEERLMYEAKENGQQLGVYNAKDLNIGLNRVKAAAAFFYLVPGPKMMWQFQELGYDIDINLNGRTGNKPLPWGAGNLGYYENEERKKLYETHAAIIQLRNSYSNVINEGDFTWVDSGKLRKINIVHPDLELTIIGNFGLDAGQIDPTFSAEGTWYDYFANESIEVVDVNENIFLQPGEFKIFTNKEVMAPKAGLVDEFKPVVITDPSEFSQKNEIKLIFDAAAADPDGTAGLMEAEKVYMHAGIVLDGPEGTIWSNTVGNLIDDGLGEMTKVVDTDHKWEITFTPQTYFNVNNNQRVYRLAMYFRDATNDNQGKAEGGEDVFLNLLPDDDQPVVITEAEVFNANTPVKIIFDASVADPAGTQGLVGADKVYMHSGVITDSETGTSWEFVVGNWGEDDGVGEMTKVSGENNNWEITITPRNYYAVPVGTPIYRLGMVFRNADGSKEGKGNNATDIFVEVDQAVTTGLDKLTSEEVLLYPNPANNKLWLRFNHNHSEISDLFMTNLLGQMVKTITLDKSRSSYEMNLDDLSPGIYLIWVQGDKKYTKRLVIGH